MFTPGPGPGPVYPRLDGSILDRCLGHARRLFRPVCTRAQGAQQPAAGRPAAPTGRARGQCAALCRRGAARRGCPPVPGASGERGDARRFRVHPTRIRARPGPGMMSRPAIPCPAGPRPPFALPRRHTPDRDPPTIPSRNAVTTRDRWRSSRTVCGEPARARARRGAPLPVAWTRPLPGPV